MPDETFGLLVMGSNFGLGFMLHRTMQNTRIVRGLKALRDLPDDRAHRLRKGAVWLLLYLDPRDSAATLLALEKDRMGRCDCPDCAFVVGKERKEPIE